MERMLYKFRNLNNSKFYHLNKMKILSLITMFVLTTIMGSAQSKGGEVSRKPKVNNNTIRNSGPSVRNNTTSSQIWIKRSFDGIVLGKSTKQNVKDYFRSRNIKFENRIESGRQAIACFNEIPFAGVTWTSLTFYFFNNIVSSISYSKDDGPERKAIIDSEHSQLTDRLTKKYKECIIKSEPYKGLDYFTVEDGKTTIQIQKGFIKDRYDLSITYWDFELSLKEYNKIHDDL